MSIKPNRFRPRFSIRTLAILITLVCCYAACWGPTKKWGVEDVEQHASNLLTTSTAAAPLLVRVDGFFVAPTGYGKVRRYYFWCFGNVAKLWERQHSDFGLDIPESMREEIGRLNSEVPTAPKRDES